MIDENLPSDSRSTVRGKVLELAQAASGRNYHLLSGCLRDLAWITTCCEDDELALLLDDYVPDQPVPIVQGQEIRHELDRLAATANEFECERVEFCIVAINSALGSGRLEQCSSLIQAFARTVMARLEIKLTHCSHL